MNKSYRHKDGDGKASYAQAIQTGAFPLFHHPWWLDIVCQAGSWDVCTVQDKAGRVVGALPYYGTSRMGLKLIRMPPFTPWLGVWLDDSACPERLSRRYSFENQVIGQLVDQLPRVAWYHQIHPEGLQNWLPFYWRGYRQTTRYTYVLAAHDPQLIFSDLKSEARTRIRKGYSLYEVVEDHTFSRFFVFYQRTMIHHGMSKHKGKVFRELHDAIQSHTAGTIYYAVDEKGIDCAAVYMIWDNQTAYYWLPCMDKVLGSNGAVQLLTWHVIQEAMKMGKTFNFEGSMLPHIEPVFRAFGAERRPVFQIRKFGNRFLEAAWVLFNGK